MLNHRLDEQERCQSEWNPELADLKLKTSFHYLGQNCHRMHSAALIVQSASDPRDLAAIGWRIRAARIGTKANPFTGDPTGLGSEEKTSQHLA
jgi:hypothetical protein